MNKDEIAELIKLLRLEAVACRRAGPSDVADKLNKAANTLTTLSAENERLERRNASDRECWRLAAENCAALSARVETLEAGMSQYLKDGQTPLERMEQDQADILGLMKLLQKEKELTEKLRWALSDAVTTNTESCRERDAALHRIEAARLGIIEGRRQAFEEAAKVADEHYMKRGNPDYLPACREIAAAIRALIEESKG